MHGVHLAGASGGSGLLNGVIIAEKDNDCTTLCEVLKRFQESGLNADTCKFQQAEVDFLGHRISAQGL